MDEVTRGWRKLHNEKLSNLYSSPSIIRVIKVTEDEMGRACSSKGRGKECIWKARTRKTSIDVGGRIVLNGFFRDSTRWYGLD
jgi:hypothetical protein